MHTPRWPVRAAVRPYAGYSGHPGNIRNDLKTKRILMDSQASAETSHGPRSRLWCNCSKRSTDLSTEIENLLRNFHADNGLVTEAGAARESRRATAIPRPRSSARASARRGCDAGKTRLGKDILRGLVASAATLRRPSCRRGCPTAGGGRRRRFHSAFPGRCGTGYEENFDERC
jgi:hypothetical protein